MFYLNSQLMHQMNGKEMNAQPSKMVGSMIKDEWLRFSNEYAFQTNHHYNRSCNPNAPLLYMSAIYNGSNLMHSEAIVLGTFYINSLYMMLI